jgi:hypothetical protein
MQATPHVCKVCRVHVQDACQVTRSRKPFVALFLRIRDIDAALWLCNVDAVLDCGSLPATALRLVLVRLRTQLRAFENLGAAQVLNRQSVAWLLAGLVTNCCTQLL